MTAVRITIVATGSRGDVQPVVALGKGLHAAGHEVTISAADDFEWLVSEAGLRFSPAGVKMAEVLASPEVRHWLGHTSHNPLAELRAMRAMMKSWAPIQARETLALSGTADLFVSGVVSAHAIAPVAAHDGVRHVVAALAPYCPTREGRSALFGRPWPGLGLANLTSGHVSLRALAWAFGGPAHLVRRELGLPTTGLGDFARTLIDTPTVLGASPHVVPQPADWPPHHTVTGYWRLPEPEGWRPDSELLEFLAAGPPPIYLGFGSMASRNGGELADLISRAAYRAGARVIAHRGAAMSELNVEGSADRVLYVDNVPHTWLFPRVAGIIHHGGAGTTAAALQAGVPSVAVPHIGDQPYWARRTHALGVGPAPMPRHQLNADTLARLLQALTGTPRYSSAAASLATRLRSEDGVARAVAVVQQLVGPDC